MRAVYYEKNGSAREVLQVGELDTPHAGPGEVRVKLATSGVNPSDVKSRQGATRKIAFPRVIPQSDGAGTIDETGAGVRTSRIGERVWVWNGQWKRAFGTAAEYIVVPAAQAVTLPENVSFEAGACLGIPAMTAHHAVALAHTEKATTLLVSGGAGSVSQYAIQFAKMRGATVIATVSSAEKAAAAMEAGADHAIDYKHDDVGERVMQITGKRGVDAVIELDLAANAKLIPGVVSSSMAPRRKRRSRPRSAWSIRSACSSSWSTNSMPPNASARYRRSPAPSNRASSSTAWPNRPLSSPAWPRHMKRSSAARSAMSSSQFEAPFASPECYLRGEKFWLGKPGALGVWITTKPMPVAWWQELQASLSLA